MATRITLPRLPKVDPSQIGSDLRAYLREIEARRPTSRQQAAKLIWQLFFAPYWLWSDMPAPRLPERDIVLPPGGMAGDQVAKTLRAIALRTWLQWALTIVARGAWLVILAAVIWLAIEIMGGPELNISALKWIAVVIFAPAVALAALSRPTRIRVAQMLDRSFRLQERMVTSLINIGRSAPAPGQRGEMPYLQVADAANAMAVVRGDPAFRVHPPIRELVLAIIFALTFASLFFLRGGGGDVPPLDSRIVPSFVPAAQQFVNTPREALPPEQMSQEVLSVAQIQELAERSNNARRDLLTLADALEDHAITRATASSLNQGNYTDAAQELRDIAQSATQLSETERSSLASDLEQASGQMTGDSESLSQTTDSAAEGLREGGPAAEQGLEDLGDAVEQTGNVTTPQEALDEAMQRAQEAESGSSESATGEQQSGQLGESLFADPALNADQASTEQGGESSRGESSSDGADPEAGLSEQSGDQSSEGPNPETGSGQSGDFNAGNAAQAPSEDILPGSGQAPYEEPEMLTNPATSMGDSELSSAGGGAGSESVETGSSESGEMQPGDASGALPDPSEANPTDAEGAEGSGDAATGDPRQAVTLARSPEGESVQIQGTGGSSSFGSGAGVSVAAGEAAQGEVGDAGPDSNHVPSDYRPIVESYFSNLEE